MGRMKNLVIYIGLLFFFTGEVLTKRSSYFQRSYLAGKSTKDADASKDKDTPKDDSKDDDKKESAAVSSSSKTTTSSSSSGSSSGSASGGSGSTKPADDKEAKPASKPDDKGDKTKPASKPADKGGEQPEGGDGSTKPAKEDDPKPETKPAEKPEEKPEEKKDPEPESKPEEGSEDKKNGFYHDDCCASERLPVALEAEKKAGNKTTGLFNLLKDDKESAPELIIQLKHSNQKV